MGEAQLPLLGGTIIKKSNVLARARWRPGSVWEPRLVALLASKVRADYYLNLQKHFAKYNLIEYLTLTSIYSQRLFEILKSWSSVPELTLQLSELHDMLATTASLRKDSRNFRIRVLEKAHLDITSKTEFKYSWELLKRGRCSCCKIHLC